MSDCFSSQTGYSFLGAQQNGGLRVTVENGQKIVSVHQEFNPVLARSFPHVSLSNRDKGEGTGKIERSQGFLGESPKRYSPGLYHPPLEQLIRVSPPQPSQDGKES